MNNYIWLAAAAFAFVVIVSVRIRFMIKGVKVNAVLSDYVTNKEGYYIPLMEFEYNGEKISMKHRGAYKSPKYETGTELTIYYIPGYEKEVKIVKDYTDVFYALIFLVAGIALTIGIIFGAK